MWIRATTKRMNKTPPPLQAKQTGLLVPPTPPTWHRLSNNMEIYKRVRFSTHKIYILYNNIHKRAYIYTTLLAYNSEYILYISHVYIYKRAALSFSLCCSVICPIRLCCVFFKSKKVMCTLPKTDGHNREKGKQNHFIFLSCCCCVLSLSSILYRRKKPFDLSETHFIFH